jgi:hypothetical protein
MASPAEIANEIAQMQAWLSAMGHDIMQVVNNVLVNLVPGAKAILTWIHDRITDLFNLVTAVGGQVKDAIGGAIGAIVPSAIDFFVSILRTMGENIGSILGNLATAEEFVASAIGEIRKHAGDGAGFITGVIGGGLLGGLSELFKWMEGQDRKTVDHFLDEILSRGPMPPWIHSMVTGIRGRGAEWQVFVLPFIVGAMLRPIGDALLDPWLKTVAYGSNKLSQTEVRSPADLIEARLRNVISDATYVDEMKLQNFNEGTSQQLLRARYRRMTPDEITPLVFRGEWEMQVAQQEGEEQGLAPGRTKAIIDAKRPLLEADQIRQIFLRGLIDRPQHDAFMAQHGFTQDRIDKMVNLYYIIPGPADLIHMGIRNVFDPQIVERFQLSQDSPPEFFKAAAMQGISRDWALKFWEAHWIVPGIDEAFRMYQRVVDNPLEPDADELTLLDGTKVYNIIGQKTLSLFLKDKDVPPYYREKITQTAYHPLNRIDVRRMFSVGSLTKAGVQRAYLNLGYSPPNALLLADFVEKFYAQTKKDKAQPIIDGLRKRILALYEQEKLDYSDAAFALSDLNFTKEEADLFLAETKLVQQAEDAQAREAGIGRIYVRGFITAEDTRSRLQRAKVPDAAIARLLAKWDLEKELHQDTEHFHKVRDLTKAEVTEAYKDQLMTGKDAAALYESLGYPTNESQMLISLADYQRERQTRKALQDAVKALYVSGLRDAVTTSNALDALALPALQRDALLAEWRLLRETRTERLPIATLRDMMKGKYLDRPAAFDHLKRHRYTDDDANLLLDFWTGVKPKGA